MRTGSSDVLFQRHRGKSRLGTRLKKARKSQHGWIDLEGLEARTLLATIPAAAPTLVNGVPQPPVDLTGLSDVTTDGDAHSPMVAVDPYDSQKIFAVWGVDGSQVVPTPGPPTAIIEGAFSSDGGVSWTSLGVNVNPPQLDPLTIGNTPPSDYAQASNPSVAFDSANNVYVLAMQFTGATDGALVMTKFNFSTNTATKVGLPNGGIIDRWITGSDAATSPTLAVDAGTHPSSVVNPPAGVPNDPFVNNVYVAWASIDVEPANPNPFVVSGFNPDRIELIVATPVASPAPGQSTLAFSGVTTVSSGANFGPALNTHPQLVINPGNASNPGQITIGWEDAGTGASISPPVTLLMSNIESPGNTFGFTGGTGFIQPGQSVTSTSTQGDWATAKIYNAGPDALNAADPLSIAIGDVNGDGLPDIVLSDASPLKSADSGIGVLLNQGGGVYPAAGVTSVYAAGPNPSNVVLDTFVPGHTATTIPIIDAAVANDSSVGGVSVLANGTPPGDGKGIFTAVGSLNTTPAQGGTAAVVSDFFDGSLKKSLVAVNASADSISWFPDASMAGAGFLSTSPRSPIAVVSGNFRGGGLPDLAVLYSNGNIQFFVNTSSGTGNISFVAGQTITGLNAVAMASGRLDGGLTDLVIADGVGNVSWLKNTSVSGGATISFNATPISIGTVVGTPVGIATGQLSSAGNYVSFLDIAVAYQAAATGAKPNESMVAVFQNSNGTFLRTSPPGVSGDFDALGTFPTSIALGYLTANTATPWEDIIVTNSANIQGRGTVSVFQPTPLPTTTVTTPITTTFNNVVSGITNPSAIDDLTVTVAVTDEQAIGNLNLVLMAPNGATITLVANQIDATGKANPSIGLPTGNAIGVFNFSPSGTTPSFTIGTTFDDNATRNIFDGTTAVPVTNGNTAAGYVGYFRPEFGSLKTFVQSLGANNINGTWRLLITNFSAATSPAPGGNLGKFSLQFSTRMTPPINPATGAPVTPTVISDIFSYFYKTNLAPFTALVIGGSLTDAYPTTAPSTPQGVGPGMVFAEDNTLGPFSPFQGRIYAAFVGYFDVLVPATNPLTNTDIFLVSSDDGGITWSAPVLVNADQGVDDGSSAANDSTTNPNNDVTGRTQFQPEIAVDQSTGTVVVSWRDARDDAGNTRVATYITTSIDGGQTFGPATYANPPKTAVDAITGQTKVLGPASDNESASNAQTDAPFGYGMQMGLAVSNGQVFPVWAGNFNGPGDSNDSFFNFATGAVDAYPLNIWYQPMTIAAGPRIISSTMGPVVDGSLSGSAIDVPEFIPAVGAPAGSPIHSTIPISGDPSLNVKSLTLTVSLIYPNDGDLTLKLIAPNGQTVILYQKPGDTGQSFANTTFSDSAATSINAASAPYSGTFKPLNPLSAFNGLQAVGNWILEVDGGIGPNGGILESWSLSINGVASKPTAFEVTFDRPVDPQSLIALGQATFTKSDVEVFYHDTTSGDAPIQLMVTNVAPLPPPDYVTDPTQNGVDGFRTFMITFNPDLKANGSPSGITNYTGTYSYVVAPDNGSATPTVISTPIWSFNTVAQPQPQITPATDPHATISPNIPIATFGPGGSGTTFDETTSDITLSGYAADQTISGLTVTLNITDPTNGLGSIGDLFIGLIAPNGVGAVLYSKPGDTNKNLTNVTFSDSGAQSILLANGPYTNGTFQGANPLAILNGSSVNGTYTLFLDNFSSINIGRLLSWSITVNSTRPALTFESGAGMDQNADGTSDENPVTTPVTGLTPGDAYMAPMPQISAPFTFNSSNFFNPPFDQNTLPLIFPGPYVMATSVPGGTGSDNLVVDGTNSSLDVTFDRPMQVSSFTPGQVLQIMGPTGSISGPQLYPSDSALQPIPAATASAPGVLSSTLTVPSFDGTFKVADITVQLNAAFATDSALTAVLIAPDGTQVQLFSGVGGAGANFINTTFDDSAENSITSGKAPFTGTFKPSGLLSSLDGKTVDMQNSAAQWVPGVWTLQITNTKTGTAGTLENWSLSITPVISVTPVNPASGLATTFAIGFPEQKLSGTYTIQIGANPTTGLFPLDQAGDGVDASLDAGLAVLRGGSPTTPVKTVGYNSKDLPKAIPAPTIADPTSEVTSTIIVPDSFLVQGDTTSSGISGLRVTVNLTYPSDPDLVLTLNHYDLNGDLLASVILASNVGGKTNSANFANTIFDDNATTPIENGGAPFSSTFNPQMPLSGFAGLNAQGTWVLVVDNSSKIGQIGTVNSWSLSFQKPAPTSGLGVPGADNISASFRIFDLNPASGISGQAWVPVGSASTGAGAGSTSASTTATAGRVSGLAIDPSDTTGNTVYATGASGGVWKTTNFLTTSPAGPTWISLTDFGPSNAVNIGSITLFPRNHDTNQTVIIAATGEPDNTPSTPGVGFLISMDGGATWTLDDSATNVDSNGNPLPIQTTNTALRRDRTFVGDTSYQVVVDPKLSPTGQIIIYAAMSGPTGGIWRSLDSGQHWVNMLPGQATAVILDQESGVTSKSGNGTTVTGNLQIVFAGIRGVGVELSPNQGLVWSVMNGGQGNPLIVNELNGVNVSPVPGLTPNGAQGKIVLASPNATGNAAEDPIYEGYLYAAVQTAGNGFLGLFETKDFGANWTQVRIPSLTQVNPTNDVGSPDYPITGTGFFTAQGNNDLIMTIDPTNPNVVYLGGSSAPPNTTGLARVDMTNIWDAHSLIPYTNFSNDGGLVNLSSTGATTVTDLTLLPPFFDNPLTGGDTTSYLNFIRNPAAPFLANATLNVFDYSAFTNSGAGVTWIPFDPGGNEYHAVTTMIDPLTGLPRLIFGNDQGVWTILDNNGTFETQVGASASGVQLGSPTAQLANVNRNGNLQITQFYYGAVQPSSAAAQIAGALFYGSAQDNGGPVSDPNILTDGNISWFGPTGPTADATGVGTDQQGLGSAYQFFWPCCAGNDTDFFQFIGPGLSGTGLNPAGQAGGGYVGRTFGLLQQAGALPTPDPQWPFGAGANFAINPVDSADVVISSSVGRIFVTENSGVTWFDVGDPGVFGNPGSFSLALAYGAPDPSVPNAPGLGNFIYVGTQTGQIYVTQNGGGSGTSNNWINISAGLDGKAVVSIVTDPIRGTHDAYAVTTDGVFYNSNSVGGASWTNITGNINNLAYSIFGQSYDPTGDTGNSIRYNQAITLSAVVADWRYQIPFNPADPSQGTHPVLYVSSGGSGSNGSGVYQSLDNGKTWALFPNAPYGGVANGGDLPHVAVTDLDVALGNIDPNTGMPLLAGPLQTFVFMGTLTSGSASVTGINNMSGLAAGDDITGAGIPAGTTILSVDVFANAITLSANATASGAKTLAAVNPNATPDPDLLLATTWGRGEFAINLAPLIVGNTVTVAPTAPGVGPNSPPFVGGPITIGGSSEISAFGNTTWITVEDVTNPGSPVFIAGFNPAGAVPVPSSSNSTGADGSFSFNFDPSTLYSPSAIGPKTIEVFATDGAGAVGNKVLFTYFWDPATQLKFDPTAEPPATAQPGANFASPTPVIVDVDDVAGHIATTYNGPVTITLAGGVSGLVGSPVTVNAVAGVATFSNLAIDTDGTYRLLASSPNLTSDTSTSIYIVGAATQLFIAQQPPGSVVAGTSFGFTVGGDDRFGNPTTIFPSNATVTVAIAANPGGSNPTGVSMTVPVVGGIATFNGLSLNKVGQAYTLKVTSAGLTSATTNPFDVTYAAADHLVITQANEPPSTVNAGQVFGMTVTALDPFGNVDKGFSGTVSVALVQPVSFSGTSTTTVSVSGGMATFGNLAITTTGTYQIQASSSPNLTQTTSTSILVNPAPNTLMTPFQLVFDGPLPTEVIHNFPFGAALDLKDFFGNLVTNATGTVTIALDNNPGNANLGGDVTADLASGIASFTNLSITAVGNGYTLQATTTVGGFTSPPSSPINVLPTPAVSLAITAEPPSSITVHQTFGIQVTALDQFGSPDPDFNKNITIALASGPAAQLGGTLTATAVNGVATFSGLSVDLVGTGYTLAASSNGLAGDTSTSFSATPAAASQLLITTEPQSSVAAGAQFSFIVTAEDQYGNVATSFNGNETVALASGPNGGTLTGTSNASAKNGVATISGLILTQAGSGYTLQVSSTGLTPATTTAIKVTPLAASRFVITTQPPSSVTAGTPFGFMVTAEDTFGNVATTFNTLVSIGLTRNPGTGTLGGTLSQPASSGVAQFSGLNLNTVGTGYTISATNGAFTSLPSSPINVTPSTATSLAVSIPPPTTMTSGSQFGLAISVLDAFGNLATGYTGVVSIALQNNPGNATLGGPLTATPVGGIANFHAFITTETAASGYTLQATSDGLTPVTTGPIKVIPAPATHLVVITQPPSLVTPGSTFGFVVAAEDDFGNISTGYTGTVTVAAPAGATLGGTTTVTPHNGQATFSGLTLTETNGGVALTVTSTGLAAATTNVVSVTTPAQLAFAASTVTVTPGTSAAAIEVMRTGGFAGAISVTVATSNGSAIAGVNYTPVNQILNFAAGQNSQTVMVPISNTTLSSNVALTVSLSNPGPNATLASQSTATVVIQAANQPPPAPALVTMQSVQLVTNKKHLVTQILVGFSGGVNAAEAKSLKTYQLIAANAAGLFKPTKKALIKIKSAALSGNSVALKLKSPLKVKKAVELIVQGLAPNGLQDTTGRLIDGNHDGVAGGNAVAVIKKPATVSINAVPRGPMAVKLFSRGK
jgi:subtilisin-like proprotein convertase family protein